MAGGRVLVIERNTASAHTLVQELESRELLARGAVYSASAMEAFQSESFDLVLTHRRL